PFGNCTEEPHALLTLFRMVETVEKFTDEATYMRNVGTNARSRSSTRPAPLLKSGTDVVFNNFHHSRPSEPLLFLPHPSQACNYSFGCQT
ncbi:hypothetical protein J1614_007435, partial [Plenodomus biglobosus]